MATQGTRQSQLKLIYANNSNSNCAITLTNAKTKTKPTQLETEIECGTTDWKSNPQVDALCKQLKLPDIYTRKGLKKFYENFDKYYKLLEALSTRYQNLPNVISGVLGIYAQLCNDSLMQTKLLEKGYLKQLVLAIETPLCQHIALIVLSDIADSSSTNIRHEIIKHVALPLVRIVEIKSPEDDVGMLALFILWECLRTSVRILGGVRRNPQLIESLPTTRIIKAVTIAAKKPTGTFLTMSSTIGLLSGLARHGGYESFKLYPEATKLLVAGLRSREWTMRVDCLQAIMALHYAEAEEKHQKLLEAIKNPQPLAPDIFMVLACYGVERCYSELSKKSNKDFKMASLKVLEDQDYYGFGEKAAALIVLQSDCAYAQGPALPVYLRFSKLATPNCQLPFDDISETLPYTAKVLRSRGGSRDLDAADILDIQYLLRKGQQAEAASLALKAVKRNWKQGYWYYAIAQSDYDMLIGLKAAKQGLKYAQLNPFLKYSLLERAVQYAAQLGFLILERDHLPGSQKWYEGIALLHSALEDSRTFISEAPPDHTHMGLVLCWNILLTSINKDISPNFLQEIQPAVTQLNFLEQLLPQIGFAIAPPVSLHTNYKHAQETIRTMYKEAAELRLTHTIELYTPILPTNPTLGQSRKTLDTWLEKVELDSVTDYHELANGRMGVVRESKCRVDETLSLHRCSWCNIASAALKKCSGCENSVAYCGTKCQKNAWPSHKNVCKSKKTI